MPRKHARYPGIEAMSHGRKRIRLRAVDPRTGRMKEVDRIFEGSIEDAVLLREQWRKEIRTSDQRSVVVPRLDDYATSWMKSRTLAVKPSTARTYAEILDCHVMPALGDFFLDKITDKDVRDWHAELAGKRATATANNALRMLKMVLVGRVRGFQPRSLAGGACPGDPASACAGRRSEHSVAGGAGEGAGRVRPVRGGRLPARADAGAHGASVRRGDGVEVGRTYGRRRDRSGWCGRSGRDTSRPRRRGWRVTVPLVAELAAALRAHRARMVAGQHAGLKEGWIFAEEEGGRSRKNYLRRPLLRVLRRWASRGGSPSTASGARSTTSRARSRARSSRARSPATSRRP